MWNQLPLRSLIDMQRKEALHQAGAKIARLHEEGYSVDADRMLDELIERMQGWREEKAA